jgi:sensor histidine kinase YesM
MISKHEDWVAYLEISKQGPGLEFSKRILGKRMTGLSHDRLLRSGQVTVMPIGGHGSGHGHASAGLVQNMPAIQGQQQLTLLLEQLTAQQQQATQQLTAQLTAQQQQLTAQLTALTAQVTAQGATLAALTARLNAK